MTFTVKYRAIDGKMREECIEAASRSECIAKCKAQGLAPISVKEGGKVSNAKAPRREERRELGGKLIWIIAGVVILGGTLWWFFGRQNEVTQIQEKPKAIKPIKPSVKRVEKPSTNSAPVLSKQERQLKQIRDKYGDNIPDNLKPVVYFLENPPQKIFHPARTKADIFKRSSEREIAAVISTEPGTWFMRRPTFGRRFDADFAESLKEDIVIAETDTAAQKALKQAVIDTKAELSARMKHGEKPSDIMNDFTGSLYELGQYRRTIEEELTRLKKDETISDKDIVDFVGAANQMLTEKGAKPIQMPKMIFRHISLKRAAAKRAQEQQVQEKNK
jgi:hypothetical protein